MVVIDKQYKFTDFNNREERNYFEYGITDIIYFPIRNTPDFPTLIMEKVNAMISDMLCTYQKEHNCTLDIADLHIDARLENFMNNEYKLINSICITITSNADDEIWMEKECYILQPDPLYVMFKDYFMKQLGKSLFGR